MPIAFAYLIYWETEDQIKPLVIAKNPEEVVSYLRRQCPFRKGYNITEVEDDIDKRGLEDLSIGISTTLSCVCVQKVPIYQRQ